MAVAAVLASTAMQAYSSYQQGQAQAAEAKAQQRMMEYNARVAEMQARAIEQKTKFDQIRQQRKGQRVMGTLRAKLGASGAMVSEGAPLNLMADQAFELALENALIGYEGQVEAGQARSQGALYSAQGGIYGMRAKNAATAGMLGAGTSLLSGFGAM